MLELKVTGMTCGGCVNSVKRAIGRIYPSGVVEVDLTTGRVTVRADTIAQAPMPTRDAVVKSIVGAGFSVEDT